MQVDKDPFPVNAIDLHGAKVRVWPKQAESTKGKNVFVDEERPRSCEDRIWSREVVLEKDVDSKDILKITVKASRLGGQAGNSMQDRALFSRTHIADRSDRSNYSEPAKDAQATEPQSG
jgi:hypothetical protein